MRNPFYNGFTMGSLLKHRENLLGSKQKKSSADKGWIKEQLYDNAEEIAFLVDAFSKKGLDCWLTRFIGMPVVCSLFKDANGFSVMGEIIEISLDEDNDGFMRGFLVRIPNHPDTLCTWAELRVAVQDSWKKVTL